MAAPATLVRVENRDLALTHLDKVLWPEDRITKGDLIGYYHQVAPYLMPHLRGRPLVLTRFPDGIHGESFYQKDRPPGAPDWLTSVDLGHDRPIRYLVANEPAALAYAANLGAIELHPWLSRADTPDFPDYAVVDLDPSPGSTFADVQVLGLLVQQLLIEVGLIGYPKLSGATGLHIFVPVAPGHRYEQTQAFAHALGKILLAAYPEKTTLERKVNKRGPKVYVDFLQNKRGQTITAVYGVRPHPGAPVSTPITWDELAAGPPRFTMHTLMRRLNQVGDLFAPVLRGGQYLAAATERLAKLAPT